VEPTSPDDEELLAALTEIEEQVVAIRGLPAADLEPPDIITRAELPDELEAIFDEQYPQAERDQDNATLRALGLLEPDQDFATLQLQLLGDQVLGFYNDIDQRMVVVTDAGLVPLAKMTYAHEYAHALQDAAFDFDALEVDAPGEDDRALGRVSLQEGDATVVMLAWGLQHLSPEELLAIGSGLELPDTTGIPNWMVQQAEFPYTVGQTWVGGLAGSPLEPEFAAVDAAWADPPDSTEQVIDPDAWDPREDPVIVETIDLAGTLGSGWNEVETTTFGQAMIDITLQHHGVGAEASADAASGWGGDRLTVANGPDDAFALAWRLAWDTPGDAAEFAEAYESILDELPFAASVTELAGGEVLVAHASSDELLAQTVSAAD
jgi:hypothetical protein